MRVINSLIVVFLVQVLIWPGTSHALDDFDFDALFDIDVEEAEPAPEPQPEPEPEPEPEPTAEPVPDVEPVSEEVPEPAAPVAPPVAPPEDDDFDFDDLFESDEDDWFWDDEEDDPVPPETVPEDVPDTDVDVDEWPDDVEEAPEDWMDDFLFPEEEEPVEDVPPLEDPAVDVIQDIDEVEDVPEPQPEPRVRTEADRVAADLAAQEEVRRQAAEVDGLQSLDAAHRALDREDYRAARDAFTRALERIPDRPARQDERENARRGLAEAHFRIAQQIYRDDGDLREARRNLARTRELSPSHRGLALLERRINREEARREAEAAQPVPIERRPEIVEKRRTIEDTLQEARAYYEAGELNRSEMLFESVLIRDPYNTDAMRYLRRIAEDQRRASDVLRRTTTEQMMRDVREAWTPPHRGEAVLPEDLARPGPQDLVTPSRRLQERMESIIIPRIEFRQANIRDVVSFLRDASEAADPEGEGVNIILNLSMPEGVSAAPAERRTPSAMDDPWGDEWDAAPAAPAGGSGVPSITLNLRRISLMEAVRFITEVAGLRFRIEDSVVVITPSGIADVGRVVTRLYPVQPSFLDVVQEREEAAPTGGFFGGAQEFGTRRAPSGTRGGDVKAFFEGAGVPFPVGTSISYNPTISQLIVANTPENLETFERILSQLNVVPSQVEIEARFVEVAEEDMRELGLQWLFTDNYEFLQRRGSAPFGGRERVQVDAGNVSAGQRFFAQPSGGVEPVRAGMEDAAFLGNILSVSSILTNPEMRVVLHALSQNGNVDVLSAPRVTTRSGVNASIEVVTEIIYPTEFRVTEPVTQSEGGLVTPPVVTPENFETRRTGVILNVTPTVGPDGYTIDLALAPEVAELVDWIQYGSQISIPGRDPDNPDRFFLRDFTFNIPQPVFASRNVQTSIVIWDGQTVVMGGLMRERLVTIKDKVPILGDIPLLGRLFRTEGSRSRKENLLIFVTARLVDPAGKPIHRADAMTLQAMD